MLPFAHQNTRTVKRPPESSVADHLLEHKLPKSTLDSLWSSQLLLLQAIADQLQGGSMQIDYDQILAKRPHSEDAIFAWHQDMAYWPPFTSDVSAATCWLAVTDSTEENGCMRFVPGSQKEPNLRKHAPGQSLASSACLALPCHTVTCPGCPALPLG